MPTKNRLAVSKCSLKKAEKIFFIIYTKMKSTHPEDKYSLLEPPSPKPVTGHYDVCKINEPSWEGLVDIFTHIRTYIFHKSLSHRAPILRSCE